MAQGAYENPRLYGVDFTKGTDIIQKGMDDAAKALRDIEEQKAKARQELEDSYAGFKDETHIEPVIAFTENMNKAIMESAKDVSLAGFSNMGATEKAKILGNVKDTKVAIQSLETIIESAQNNVIDGRVKAEHFDFVKDLMNGKNLEVSKAGDGVGFKITHTKRDGSKEVYDPSKLAMMAVMFEDVEPVLSEIDTEVESLTGKLQKQKEARIQTGQGDLTIDDIKAQAKDYIQNLPQEEAEIYFAENVPDDRGITGRELVPREVNGRKLSEEERAKISAQRYEEFADYLAGVMERDINPYNAPPPEMSEREKMMIERGTKVAVEEAKNRGRGNNEFLRDEDLLQGLQNMRTNIIRAESIEGRLNSGIEVPTGKDSYTLVNRPFKYGEKVGTIVNQNLSKNGVLELTIAFKDYTPDVGFFTTKETVTQDLKEDGAVQAIYRNILRSETKSGTIGGVEVDVPLEDDEADTVDDIFNEETSTLNER